MSSINHTLPLPISLKDATLLIGRSVSLLTENECMTGGLQMLQDDPNSFNPGYISSISLAKLVQGFLQKTPAASFDLQLKDQTLDSEQVIEHILKRGVHVEANATHVFAAEESRAKDRLTRDESALLQGAHYLNQLTQKIPAHNQQALEIIARNKLLNSQYKVNSDGVLQIPSDEAVKIYSRHASEFSTYTTVSPVVREPMVC